MVVSETERYKIGILIVTESVTVVLSDTFMVPGATVMIFVDSPMVVVSDTEI